MKKIIVFLITSIFIYANEINLSIENNNTIQELNETNLSTKNDIPNPIIIEEFFDASYVTLKNKVNLAIIINKKRFFKYLPSIINGINAYFIQKGVEFDIRVYDIDVNISSIPYNDIICFATKNIDSLYKYKKTFYLPLVNKNETSQINYNICYGLIDFKKQIDKLKTFINKKTFIINDTTYISKKILNYEKNIPYIKKIYTFPKISYWRLRDSFLIFNTPASKTAQVLSTLTQKEINTVLTLSPQLGYDPLMILLTQPKDVKNLIIANSIINPPLLINEYANLLNSDIKYNWMNYATLILANKIYNKQNSEELFFMSDFNIYIFNNQIDYKVKLYKIISSSFKEVQ